MAQEKSLSQRGVDGDYALIEPLDYLILGELPDEGELVMGYYPMMLTTKQLSRNQFKGLRPAQLAPAMTRLKKQGLAVRLRALSTREEGYQRTAKGKKLFESWKSKQPRTSPGQQEKTK